MSLRLAKAGGANKFKPSRPAPKKAAPTPAQSQTPVPIPSTSAAPDEATSPTFNSARSSQDIQVPSYTQGSESLPDLTQASSIAPSTQPPQTQEDPTFTHPPSQIATLPDKSSKGNAFAFGSLASLEASHTADPQWIPVPQSTDSRPPSRAITPSMPLDASVEESTAPATAASTTKEPESKSRKRKASPAKASEDTTSAKKAKKPKSSDKSKGKRDAGATAAEAADMPIDNALAEEQVEGTPDTNRAEVVGSSLPEAAASEERAEGAEKAQSDAQSSKEVKKRKTPKPSSKRKRASAALSEPEEPEPAPEMESQPADAEASEPIASTSAAVADNNESPIESQSKKARKPKATSKRKRAANTATEDEAADGSAQPDIVDSTSSASARIGRKGKGKAKAKDVTPSELAEGNPRNADIGNDVLDEIRGFIEAAESKRELDGGGPSGASDDEVSDTGTEGVENVLLDMAAGRRNSLRSRKKDGMTLIYQPDEPPGDEEHQEDGVDGEADAKADASAAQPKTPRKKKKKAGETEDEAEYVSGAESSTKEKKAKKPKKEKPPPLLGPDGLPVKRGRGRPRKDPSELAKNKKKAAARKLKKPKAVPGLSDGEEEDAENAGDEEGGEEGETRQLGPLDPSRVTMAALIKDTGRGQISRFMRKKMEDKANQRLRMKNARERMRKKAALEREGISAEEVQRRLDEEENGRASAAPDPGSPGAEREATADQQGNDEDDAAPEQGDDEQEDGDDDRAPVKQDASQFSFRAPKNLLEGNYIGNEQAERGDVEDEPVEPDSDDEGMPAASQHRPRVQESAQPTENGHDGEEGEDDYEGLQETQFAPQMKLVDGEWVVDEASTQIARGPDAHTRYENVAEEDVQRRVTSYTDGRAQKRRLDRIAAGNKNGKWSRADTELFYEGLSQFGTDFELIAGMFAYRDRRQIKNKWDREEKKCPERIDEALKVKKKINISFYEEVTSWDLSNGPIPADPMHRYYEGLPTLEEKVKLESNRAPSHEPELLARKKEESSRPAGEDGDAVGDDGVGQAEDGNQPLFNPHSDAEEEADDGGAAEPEEGQEAPDEGAGEEGEPEAEPEAEAEGGEQEEEEAGAGAEEEEPFDFSALGGIAIKSTA